MLRLASQNDGAMTSSSEVTSSSSSSSSAAASAGFSATSMFINAFFSTNINSPMTRESFEFLQDLDDSFGEQPTYTTHQQRYHQDTIMNRFMTQHNNNSSTVPVITTGIWWRSPTFIYQWNNIVASSSGWGLFIFP